MTLGNESSALAGMPLSPCVGYDERVPHVPANVVIDPLEAGEYRITQCRELSTTKMSVEPLSTVNDVGLTICAGVATCTSGSSRFGKKYSPPR